MATFLGADIGKKRDPCGTPLAPTASRLQLLHRDTAPLRMALWELEA